MPDEEKKFKVTIGPEKHTPIKSGIYRGKLVDIAIGKGAFGQSVYLLLWEILDDLQYRGRRLRDFVNPSSNGVRGKLWKLRRALTLEELDIFESFDMGELIGKECFIDVVPKGGFNVIKEYIHSNDLKDTERLSFPTKF